MKKAIVIGASSGIGREIAKGLLKIDYKVAVTARRINLLNELQHEFGEQCVAKQMDITHFESTISTVPKASKQILNAIYNKRKVVYITKRWGIIALVFRFLPKFIYDRMG
jgi:short-subunit dehydrogenase